MKVSGTTAAAIMVANFVLAVWMIYFIVKAAAHVGAWPFA